MFEPKSEQYGDVWVYAPKLGDIAAIHDKPKETQTAHLMMLCVRDAEGKPIFTEPESVLACSVSDITAMANIIERLSEPPELTPLSEPPMLTLNYGA